jgi:hypothetical protein
LKFSGYSAGTFTLKQGVLFRLDSPRVSIPFAFSLDIGHMAKLKRTLDRKEPTVKVPFNMAEPNDDLHAYGWSMDRLRYPSVNSTKTDVWAGRSVFDIDINNELQTVYGYNIDFVNPKYVQVMLDSSPKVMAACQKAAEAKYSEDSLVNLRKVVMSEFKELVLPDMLARFKKVAGMVGQFYAARMAHVRTHGAEENDSE